MTKKQSKMAVSMNKIEWRLRMQVPAHAKQSSTSLHVSIGPLLVGSILGS